MLEHHRETIRSAEVARLDRLERKGLLRRPFSKPDKEVDQQANERFVEVYYASVERCFIPLNFNEEHPLYILDVGETLLILFGQWLYDPHTLVVPTDTYDKWIPDQNFFAAFSLKCSDDVGNVFEAKIEEASFIRAERLTSQLKFKRLREFQSVEGGSETLTQDLERAGLLRAE